MSVVAIAHIETGKRWAGLGTLNKIANSLKGSVSDLFKGIYRLSHKKVNFLN